MDICRKISGIFLVAIVVLTTTLQFHHHDCHGVVFFGQTCCEDNVIVAHHHHAPDCKGHGRCSMHLGQTDIVKAGAVVADVHVNASADFRNGPTCDNTGIQFQEFTDFHFLKHISLIIRSSSIFRAPPATQL